MSGCLIGRQKGNIISRDRVLWCAYAVSKAANGKRYFSLLGYMGGKYSLKFANKHNLLCKNN